MGFGLLFRKRIVSVPFEMEQVEVGMLTPVFPLPEKSQKECSLSKQLIKDLDYSIPLIPHSHLKLSCLKSGVRVGSHDPFFRNNYFSGIVSAHRILICMTNFFEFE